MPKITPAELNTLRDHLNSHGISNDVTTLRLSTRAKRLIFTSSVKKGVEIVIPQNADRVWVSEMVEKRVQWIRDAEQRINESRCQLNPTTIYLKALSEIWTVATKTPNETGCTPTVEDGHQITVHIDPNDVFCVARYLQQWLHSKAKASLFPWLTSLADKRELSFNRVSIRNQSTRWGSCSAKGNINLNQNLLFLPKHLVEYVLQHELNHINCLNHSESFWRSFSKVLPNFKELRSELKDSETTVIPMWASQKFNRR